MTTVQGLNSLELGNGPPKPLVAISILNWNGWRDTIECLESVRKLDYPDYLTVVVDNGSANDSLPKLRDWARQNLPDQRGFVEYPMEVACQGGAQAQEAALGTLVPRDRLVLVCNRENLGFAGGNNVTVQYVLRRSPAADYVFLLNNDATADEACLTRLAEAAQSSEAGIVGAVIKQRGGSDIAFAGLDGSFPLLRQFFPPFLNFRAALPNPEAEFCVSFWVSGGAMFLRKDVLENMYKSTGCYLDDALFLYGEDVDFCGRARKLGYRSVVANRAVVYHGEASSSGGRFNPIAYYYSNRNRVRVARHLLPWPLRPLFHGLNVSLCLGRAGKNFWRGQKRAALAILRGTLDGYCGKFGKWKEHDALAMTKRRAEAGPS